MALNYQFSMPQSQRVHFAGTGMSTTVEPFGGIAQELNMPSLLESVSPGPLSTSFTGEGYTLPTSIAGSGASGGSPNTGAGAGGVSGMMGGVSTGVAIGQAIGSVYAAFESGKTAKYVGKKQAEIAENNRQMAQMSAESAYRQGEDQMARLTYHAGQVKAQQRVAMGANGVRIGSGSTAEVLASTDVMKKLDMNSAKLSAISSAWGYKSQAYQASNQGAVAQIMGNYANDSKIGAAVGGLMDKGSLVADRWHKYFGGQ